MSILSWKPLCILFPILFGPWGFPHLMAQFTYQGSPFCAGYQGNVPPSNPPSGSGVFTYTSSNGNSHLDIHLTNGTVNLANSDPGTYTVTHQPIPQGTATNTTITLYGANSSYFSYPQSTYCTTLLHATPDPGFLPGGNFTGIGPVFTTIDSTTGVIDIGASMDVNNSQHIIQYVLGGHCDDTTSVVLQLQDPVADFTLSSTQYCRSGNGPIKATNITGRGIFEVFRNGIPINSFDNYNGSSFRTTKTLLSQQAMIPASYTVNFTLDTDANGCSAMVSKSFTIIGTNNYSASYTASSFCQDLTTLQSPSISTLIQCSTCVEWFSDISGLHIDSVSGDIQPDSSQAGSYNIYVEIADGICLDTFQIGSGPVIIDSLIKSEIIYNDVVCKNGHQTPQPLSNPTPASGTLTSSGGLSIGPNHSLLINALPDQAGDRNFDLIYSPNIGVCAIPDTFTITVRQFLGEFGYQDSTLCQAQPMQFPINIYTQGIGYSMYFINDPGSPSPGYLDIDSVCGKIEPQNSVFGTFLPSLVMKDSLCADTFPASQFITIFPNPNPDFGLPRDVCHHPGILAAQPDSLGGDFSAISQSGSGTLLIGPSGVIDLTNSSPGTYLITHDLPQYGCPVDSTKLFTINELFYSNIEYTADTFCSSENSYYPFTNGGGVGTGSFWSDPTTVVHPDSGILDVSNPGTYTIYYVVDSSYRPCPIPDTLVIHINPGNSQEFLYQLPAYCNSTSIASIDTSSLASLFGRFYNMDSTRTLEIDSITGQINLLQSDTGTFQLAYHLPGQGWCPEIQMGTVRIIGSDIQTSFSFSDTLWCQSDSIIYPILGPGSDSTGEFFSFNNLDWVSTPTSPFKGIDLSSPFSGDATIGYALGGVCRDSFSFDITILPYDSVWLEYGDSTVCNIDSLLPETFGVFPGTFSEPTGSIVFLDTLTGLINLEESRSGTYNIVYTSAQNCPAKAVFPLKIESANSPFLPNYSDTTLCIGDTLIISTFYTNDIHYLVNGVLIDSNVQSVNYVVQDLENEVFLVQDSSLPCPRHYHQNVTGNEVPILTLPYDSLNVAAGASLNIPLESNIDSTFFLVSTTTIGPVWANVYDAGAFMVPNPVNLQVDVHTSDEFVPGTILMEVTPLSKNCYGNPDTLPLNVNSGTNPIFVPEVFTPNGDGVNETWDIWWNSEENPLNYHIDVYNNSMGKVHTVKNLTRKWDGSNVPAGVYWWILKDNAGNNIQSGGLTIRKF